MSISVDDLVTSLSGNHIGEEAADLAILQAQLAQTLLSHDIAPNIHAQNGRHDTDDLPLCNTPTTRTRASSLSFGQMGDMTMAQRRSSSAASRSRSRKNSVVVDGNWEDVDEMDEDEQMVEDLVTPSSPMSSTCAATSNFMLSHRRMSSSSSSRSSMAATQSSYHDASLFTTTDPFYIAQLQASQNPPASSSSVFAQSGRPAPHSPFLQRHQPQNIYAYPVPTSAAFDR